MSPAAQNVIDRLDGTRQNWWVFSLLSTGVWSLSLSIGLFVMLMLLDARFQFSQVPLVLMFSVWIIVTVTLAVLVVRRLLRSQRTLEATARCVEYEYPELGSDLINIVQLSEDVVNENRDFCVAAVNQSVSRIGMVRFEDAAAEETRWRRFRHCMQTSRDFSESIGVFALVVVLAIVCHVLMPNWSSAANRLMTPWKFVPSVGKIKLEVTPGDAEIAIGTMLEITAEVRNLPEPDAEKPLEATLFIRTEGEDETEMLMTPGEPFTVEAEGNSAGSTSGSGNAAGNTVQRRQRFTVKLPSVLKPLKYRVEVGDSQSSVYTVKLIDKPAIEEVEITYRYPAYLARPDETVVQRVPDLEAPQYTTAMLKVHATSPITSGRLDWEGGGITGQVGDDGRTLTAELAMVRNTVFSVDLRNGEYGDENPRMNRVRVLPDNPPTVDLMKPPRKITASTGDEIAVMVRAGDDHGLGSVRLEYKVRATGSASGTATNEATAGSAIDKSDADLAAEDAFDSAFDDGFGPGEVASAATSDSTESAIETTTAPSSGSIADLEESLTRRLHEWTEFENDRSTVLTHRITLSDEMAVPGFTVYVRAVAVDRRNYADYGLSLTPQETASGWHMIEIVDKDADVESTLQQLDNLRAAIFKILEKQIKAQAINALISHRDSMDDAVGLTNELRGIQVDVQKSTIALVKSIGETEREERQLIKQRLNQLAFTRMIEAVKQCDALKKVTDLSGYEQPSSELYTTQTEIIAVLRTMLNITRRAQSKELAEMEHRSEGDLPDDAKQKLDDINNALEAALEAQKKVIEASENLAKAPVEDFSEEEKQLVKALEAAEDAWDKFMKELNTDLSKLPEQDFANPSMLKELVEIQTEIKMAEDALLAKTKDIAVPLEQLGAEMAEEIQTNMEKWLPDTPDRERWSQEESLTDEGKEAPAAELPGELEDLIGELMEEEEDLFDEMEDVSSSAMDSLDKGAGWDVSDGPISNMSAKGATGNRLPNSSEIGGRAGEGRQGKSSGEFVGDEAVGKGGRNTPARLTPDAYVKGQIKDHSKDPTGGATGGGKESGEGGEGLEGPQPGSRGERDNNRLSGKQAALRNKAEGIDLQHYKVMGYHHTDLQDMIERMNQVELDLKAGRYQNALRQRKVLLEGLGEVKQHVGGDFEVRADESMNLPTDVQKEILGSMEEASPIGWEQMNRDYFKRLTGSGAME